MELGKPSRNNHIKARELYYGNCLMSIVISTFREEYFHFRRRNDLGEPDSTKRRQPWSFPNATECLLVGDFNGIARDRVEFELSPSIRRRRLPAPVFSAKRDSRN